MPNITTPVPTAPKTISQGNFVTGGGVVLVGFIVMPDVSAKDMFSYSSGIFSPPNKQYFRV